MGFVQRFRGPMFLLATFAIVSISISFLCSVLEAALLSLTPSYIAQQRELRPRLHTALNRLKENIDQPLAAILTLNTIAHTAGATGVGAQVTLLYGEAYLGVASGIMTLLILIFSEIIPKTIGAKFWRQLAPCLPPVLRAMVLALKPFIWLSEQITRRIGGNQADVDLRGEIKALTQIGLEEDALDSDESRVITNILNLHDIQVTAAMTPRTVCVTVDPEMTVAEFYQKLGKSPFTRFPVMDREEQALGYIHKADTHHAEDTLTLKALMHPVEAVHPDENVERVLAMMLRARQHLCVIHDYLGTWLGIVTMEDVLETILGQDIVDETDNVSNMRKYARQRWTKRLKKNQANKKLVRGPDKP